MDEILSKFLDDDLRIRIVKDVIRMSDNESIIDEFEQRTLEAIQEYDTQKYIRKEALREGRSEGIRQGREEGTQCDYVLSKEGKYHEQSSYYRR